LFNVVYSQNNMLLTAKLVRKCSHMFFWDTVYIADSLRFTSTKIYFKKFNLKLKISKKKYLQSIV